MGLTGRLQVVSECLWGMMTVGQPDRRDRSSPVVDDGEQMEEKH